MQAPSYHEHQFVGTPPRCNQAGCEIAKSDCWRTPLDHLERVFRVLGDVDLDPCADVNPDNHFASANLVHHGLNHLWRGRVFMNPPYSQASKWVPYAWNSGAPVLGLIHVATASNYWHRSIWGCAQRICFVHGRIEFVDPITNEPCKQNRYDSVFVLWNATAEQRSAFDREYSKIGWLPR